jgi:hypothetical protein
VSETFDEADEITSAEFGKRATGCRCGATKRALDRCPICHTTGEGRTAESIAAGEQPAPKPNAGVPVWQLVVDDMLQRDRVGRERYGTPLQPFNGRRSIVDAYQEALDLCVYLRQRIAEDDVERTRRLLPEEAALLDAVRALGYARGRELAMGYHTAIDWRPDHELATRYNEALAAYLARNGEG